MGLAEDDRVADPQGSRRSAPASREDGAPGTTRLRLGGGDADVVPFRGGRASLAERLQRRWAEEEAAERERRARVERERAGGDSGTSDRLEQRRRERLERLRRERSERERHERYVWSGRRK